jgi:hypothetical protein
MEAISHQNVKLKRGRHASPEKGACLLELASMLAGEPFSDRPRAVCPMIGAYMRAVNDYVDDGDRQLLLPYAPALVGTAGSTRQSRSRLEVCCRWTREMGEATRRRVAFLRWAEGYSRIGELTGRAALRRGLLPALALADALLEMAGAEIDHPQPLPGMRQSAGP